MFAENQETLRPVLISMLLFYVIVKMLPTIVKKPTGIKLLDDIVLLSISQQSFLLAGAVLTGVVVYLAGMANEWYMSSGTPGSSSGPDLPPPVPLNE